MTGGIITISKGANSITGTQGITAGRYVYDLEVINNSTGDVQRIVEGVITVLLKRRNNDINKIVKQFYNGENYDARP